MNEPTQVVVTPLDQHRMVTVSVIDSRPVVQVAQQVMADLEQTFETLAQNVKGLPFVLQRDVQGRLVAVEYANGQIVKTLQRNGSGQLAAVVLTGTALGQRVLTKRLLRTNGVLSSAAYEVAA